ncbi:uncharacterized protein LOC132702460 isoform X2 [Cylas formicarius]|uniref:uncharacterized protein LOC132702460 isoform X2 n=1 Tax=Cylas formicarius TaxID=197179 RepID=UPI00295856CD|nr:uncharacterized protein LOC132702460 isoform X2 [Cylas formicarius]
MGLPGNISKDNLSSNLKELQTHEKKLRSEITYCKSLLKPKTDINDDENCDLPAQHKVSKRRNQEFKEVNEFFDYVHSNGGHENGWKTEDHLQFLKYRSKFKRAEDIARHLHDLLPDIDVDEIIAHERWYVTYLELLSKKKDAIERWRKSKKTQKKEPAVSDEKQSKRDTWKNTNDDALRAKIALWKEEREAKVRAENAERRRKIDARCKQEQIERVKRNDIKKVVREWRESKQLAGENEKNRRAALESLQSKLRSATANRMIKTYQSMDEAHVKKMLQIHASEKQKSIRIRSSCEANRDPDRLMKPTQQWMNRLRAPRDVAVCQIPEARMPKLAVPDWRKDLLTYVTFGVLFNLLWPQITINQCTSARGELVKHMPCGMVTQNYFPFDTRDTYVYWTIFFYFVNFCLHICVAFSIGTSVFIGLLMHTIGQLKNCSSYFKSIFFGADIATKFRLSYCIRYHQTILSYAERIFSTFTSILITYVTITSFTFAVVSYQIANSKTAIEERIRYVLLLVGWIILFFLICFFAQEVIDQSLKVGDAVYHSNWHLVAGTDEIKRSLAVVILRTQRPICWKVKYIGTMSLFTFVYVIKTSYTFFTLLLTATDSA